MIYYKYKQFKFVMHGFDYLTKLTYDITYAF